MTTVRELLEPLTSAAPPPPSLDELTDRVSRRANDRRRHRRAGLALLGVATVVGGVVAGISQTAGDTTVIPGPIPGVAPVRINLPGGAADAGGLLPSLTTFDSLLPSLVVTASPDQRTWNINDEISGSNFAVSRAWVHPSETIPPDHLDSVVATVVRFPAAADAAAWAHARPVLPSTAIAGKGTFPADFTAYAQPDLPGFVATFTAGPLAFQLEMLGPVTEVHQADFFVLADAWLSELPPGMSGRVPTGTIQGWLELVGPSVPGGTRFVSGTIIVRMAKGGPTTAEPIGPDGVFQMLLPQGAYTLTGRSPLYQAGRSSCTLSGPVRVSANRTTPVTVACFVK